MSQEHPYHNFKVPNDAPFMLKPSPGKGWGAFATRRIKRGAMILKEKPLFAIRKDFNDMREEDVQREFQKLAPSEKLLFLCLRDNSYTPFKEVGQAYFKNIFVTSKPQPKGPTVHGVFLLHSRFNHSCIPNSRVPCTGEEIITRYATRDIAAGEEITFCYSSYFEIMIRRGRHEDLGFTCNCKACLIGTSFQQLSDLRRTFLRGLEYLRRGRDREGQIEGSTSPIILHPGLKKAAEEFRLQISANFVYDILTAFLLEEEGLLDDFVLEIIVPRILKTLGLFKTVGNARIARLAVAQETWFEKLCIAFNLYRRADAADYEYLGFQQA